MLSALYYTWIGPDLVLTFDQSMLGLEFEAVTQPCQFLSAIMYDL